jgi:hypothetical protein
MNERMIVEYAVWSLELNIECPNPECEHRFDYLQTKEYTEQDGWEGLKHCESDNMANIKVKCPECGTDLLIKTTWY